MPKKRNSASVRKKAEKLRKRALFKFRSGLLEEAESDFKRVLKLVPDNAPVLNNLGVIYTYYAKYEQAIAYFNKALRVDRHNVFTLAFLSILHLLWYDEKEQALKYATKAYNYVISLNPDRFSSYFEYHTAGYLSMLLIALGLLDQHQKIIKLEKQFGLILYSFLDSGDILNIAIAYANEGDYDYALTLMNSYDISDHKKYSIYFNLVNFLREHNIRLKLDYIIFDISLLTLYLNRLWERVMANEKGFFIVYYLTLHDKTLTELAWALLSDEFSFYDKELIIEVLFATKREDLATFLKSVLYYGNLPTDLQISLYILAVLVRGYTLNDDDIKEIKNEKFKEFVREYNRYLLDTEDLTVERDKLVIYRKLLDQYYKFYEKYKNHLIFLNMLELNKALMRDPEVKNNEEKNKIFRVFINKLIKIARDAKNPFYMLDIARTISLVAPNCKKIFDITLDALKLAKPNKQLPVIYQAMLLLISENLKRLECKEEYINTIEKIINEKKIMSYEKASLAFSKLVLLGLSKLLRKKISLTKKMHKKYFEKTISPEMSLTDLLGNYNVYMLIGIAKYLQSIEVIKAIPRKKKMLIEEINKAVKGNIEKVIEHLKEKKLKNAFEYILMHQGIVDFDKFVEKYGSDEGESIYWDFAPPKSILGKLKLTGIIFVGVYQNKKIIFIPKEILRALTR